jgi:2-iminobutanoate/2-iminopropanoate deaminase
MPKLVAPALCFAAVTFIATAAISTAAMAQSAPAFEKKNYNYAEWAKGRFSEVVTATGPAKMIFLAGVGAEDEGATRGVIRHLGDFMGQCRYAYDKIKRALEKNGASLADTVKIVTYVTDIRFQMDAGKCRGEAFAGLPLPVHTFLNINQLAWPGMLVEVDVTAVVGSK